MRVAMSWVPSRENVWWTHSGAVLTSRMVAAVGGSRGVTHRASMARILVPKSFHGRGPWAEVRVQAARHVDGDASLGQVGRPLEPDHPVGRGHIVESESLSCHQGLCFGVDDKSPRR
ncbi:hypothetical protein DEJ48_01910 [Streptomyces venezuelae]|uniref:Uncharacterized protein n=1 Tax=Streptomyces venezuelae TaxID=54571 RepID=A0A5P2BQ90_STRVZ|nr:hypothetical protein [Streptomyces venezuelae]QES32327.1 hypothetical protein DEJ48_01910 [Streptomyces venezuelae]